MYITFNNVKHYLYYNRCNDCKGIISLNECNDCKELYCSKCDELINNCCDYCHILKYKYEKYKRQYNRQVLNTKRYIKQSTI